MSNPSNKARLDIITYKQEGDLAHQYQAFRNVIDSANELVDFNTNELKIDLNNPLNIECQQSYDGTVNLIINDDKNPPRIINSRFSKLEDNRYKIINRNQLQQTNLYRAGKIDQQTRLFRNLNKIPKVDLVNVLNSGQLYGGNYTFYIKFADNDYNKTDVVAESGQVSIFKGYIGKPASISGTLLDERTDKAITFKISNIDTSFSKLYLYYIRETCDDNGIRLTKAALISNPCDIKNDIEFITINGYEDIEEISPEEINIQYNLVTSVKTQTQVQNMLFFGNIKGVDINVKDLQNISYFIKVKLKQTEEDIDSPGWIDPSNYSVKNNASLDSTEYYNPINVYYKLGYWPGEIYRLGIVYIMNDDSLSPVFNLRGCEFTSINNNNGSTNIPSTSSYKDLFVSGHSGEMNYLDRNVFLSGENNFSNTFGVFKNHVSEVIDYQNELIKPLYYEISFTDDVANALKNSIYGIKGFFIVRQKRIPTTLCQGLSVGIDTASYTPMLYDSTNNYYITEGFLSENGLLTHSFDKHIKTTTTKQCSGLLSSDSILNQSLQSNFDGTEFVLSPVTTSGGTLSNNLRYYYVKGPSTNSTNTSDKQISTQVTYINSEVPLKSINGYNYSTKCGAAEDVGQFSFFKNIDYTKYNYNLLRGIYCPFLGANASLQNNTIYNIKIPNYSNVKIKDYFSIRGKDTSPFFAVSQRYELSSINTNTDVDYSIDVYRGDCYSCTTTIRLNRNFVDSEVPINEFIINPSTWKNNYKGYLNTTKEETDDKDKGSFASINRADVNTVNLGMWITYKCLSNYNLGLRSEDRSHSDEAALMGGFRTFYPLRDVSTSVSSKIAESELLNDGYSATVGTKRYFAADDVPYVKEIFDTRVMFSNVQREDNFQNAYRIFQGLSFKDIDRQYGAIVKFIPWGVNILCVFEHGIGILPINEKALIQTNTGQSIHMYGAEVLQNQITLITPDFGSIWPESVIRTPLGVYGVDTYAKKIWRYTNEGKFENISDMKIQQFLNDNIKLSEKEKYPIVALKNVKSHYNNYKGDIMFTFYNEAKNTSWNLCYNERVDKWITRYSWTPLYSENINNIFYSLDQKRASILSYIYNNKHCTLGLASSINKWDLTKSTSGGQLAVEDFRSILEVKGYSLADSFTYTINSISTSYLSDTDKEIDVTISDSSIISNMFQIDSYGILSGKFDAIYNYFDNLCGAFPVYFKLHMTVNMAVDSSNAGSFDDIIGIVVENRKNNNEWILSDDIYTKYCNAFLRNGFYVHGRAGIFDQINYEDQSFDNQILPTKWYEKQEPFEFEFVVNDDVGLHKIFDNLVIVSNNVQPEEIQYEIIGDVYKFNKSAIYRNQKFREDIWYQDRRSTKPGVVIPNKPDGTDDINPNDWPTSEFKGQIGKPRTSSAKKNKYQSTQAFINSNIKWDNTLNSYSVVLTQPCKNIEEFGRRLGNIHYKEDSWYITIDPIMYREKYKVNDSTEKTWSQIKSVRLRDKFIKIRVKYTGEDIVIITALKTLLTLSYS